MFKNVNELITKLEATHSQKASLSLDYMDGYLSLFNHPEKNVPFIHIGGTNGKGTCVTYLKKILMENSKNVATFTSPYVNFFNERIQVNDNYISDQDLLKYANKIAEKCSVLPSFFDFLTILALIYFSDLYKEKKIDIAILEVGLGGRFDPTNVITPLVSAVVSVGYDHMDVLGLSLEEIWKNKLGILKKDIPFVAYSSEYDYLIKDENKKSRDDSNLFLIKKSDIKSIRCNLDYTMFDTVELKNICLAKLGAYQAENAYLAMSIIEVLNKVYNYNITDNEILAGLAKTEISGRLEIINKDPLIIIDGAHNEDACKRLMEFISECKFTLPLRFCFAASSNKDIRKMIEIIDGYADCIIFSEFNGKRKTDAEMLYDMSKNKNKMIIKDNSLILPYLKEDKTYVNIIFGSFFFISEIKKKTKGDN